MIGNSMKWKSARNGNFKTNDKKTGNGCSIILMLTKTIRHVPCIQYSNANTNKLSNLKKKNLVVTEWKNFRFSTAVDHENSKGHTDSCAKQTAEQNPPKKPSIQFIVIIE